MAKKGTKRKKLKEIKEQKKQQKQVGEIRSKKKIGEHPMDQMQFKSRANEAASDRLIMEFLENHLPKIMNIIPAEERDKLGEEGLTPGKLFDENLRTINTKDTYVKRIKTFIKWHAVEKKFNSLGEITEESTKEFFKIYADNIGTEKGQYSTKTYDSYVDGVYKYWEAVTRKPEDAIVQLEGREFAPPIESAMSLKDRNFKKELRDMVPNYSQEDYKRGKKGGYTIRDAQIIMKQAKKHMDIEKQLLVATLVYGGTRNDEAQNFSLECYDAENKKIDMLKNHMNKQNRPRVVLDVNEKLFGVVEKYKDETGASPSDEIFRKYSSDDVREIVQELCRLGKIGYSGVHDLRKPFIETLDRKIFDGIMKGEITKHDLAVKIMEQVSADPRLNRPVKVKEWRSRTDKNGNEKWYLVNKKPVEMEPKFSYEKLMSMNIENVAEIFIAEQLGHNKMETNMEYRSNEAKKYRKGFRQEMKRRRKDGVKGL